MQLSCTDRHLRRIFTATYHVTPVQYLQTCRLHLAKHLLTDTDLSVIDVAMWSGFGSLRRFNDLFKKRYHLSPTALRKKTVEKTLQKDSITLALGYRPPYRWEEMLKFLSGRAITGVELVRDGKYFRTVHMITPEGKPVYGWVRVSHNPQKNALNVTLNESLLKVLPEVLARIRQLFDLYCDPEVVYETLSAMNNIRPGLCVPGIRIPGCFNVFELAVRAVLGQQITVKAASTLADRIAQAYGRPVETGIEGLTHAFPSPEDILALEGPLENHLGAWGVTAARSGTIRALAEALAKKQIQFGPYARPEEEIKKLMAIRGIGSWTAHYIAMRAMAWPDAFLETDAGIKKALEPYTSKKLLKMAEAWQPWRSYATINLWNTL